MKYLSKKELIIELNKILPYDANDIEKELEVEIKSTVNDRNFIVVEECKNSTANTNDIILNIEDIKHILNNKDFILINDAQYTGHNTCKKVIELAIEEFILEDIFKNYVVSFLVFFKVHPEYQIIDICDGLEVINKLTDTSGTIFTSGEEPSGTFGIYCDEKLPKDYVKATIILGCFEIKKLVYANNYIESSC